MVRLRDTYGFDAFKWRVGAECGRDKDEWPGRTEEVVPVVSRALARSRMPRIDPRYLIAPVRSP